MANGHQVAMALRSAYLTMHRRADAVLAPHGLTANQFVLLALLAEQDAVTQQDLARRAASDANTIRPMLVTLHKSGLVDRKRHPSDGRAWCVRLTPEGKRVFQAARSDSEPFRKQLISALAGSEASRLVSLLEKIALVMNEEVIQHVE